MQLVFEYSGWCSIDAEDVKFVYIGEAQLCDGSITGEEWASLSEEDQEDYILDSYIDIIKDSTDGEWIDSQIYIEAASQQTGGLVL